MARPYLNKTKQTQNKQEEEKEGEEEEDTEIIRSPYMALLI